MRLLDRTIINYLIYSVLVVLIGIPAFYLVITKLFTDDVDETLVLRKNDLKHKIERTKSDQDIKLWEAFDRNMQIKPFHKAHADSLYFITQFDSLEHEMEPYRVLSSVILIHDRPHELVLRLSLVENEDLIKTIVTTQAVILIVLVCGLVLINWRVSKQIWKPFYSVLEKLRQFELDKNPVIDLDHSNIKEFEDLNHAIAHLTDHTYKVYISQKEFTENASHEMQTPLAIFQARLELLMQSQGLSEEQALLIQSLMEATSRLNRLNKSLLLLSRIDNHQFMETEMVDIISLTRQVADQFKDQREVRSITMTIESASDCTLHINRTLIEILLSNLIANAIRYNHDQGEVGIVIMNDRWIISNTGPMLSISSDRIFDRFQKGNQNPVGLGLGLSIVKKICDATGFTIIYSFQHNKHIFTLRF